MTTLAVYERPMCCSTGVCGPVVDKALVQFSADLEWIERHGTTVERYNLSQQPDAFVDNEAVVKALREGGNECLPLILVDGEVFSCGSYPSRDTLSSWLSIDVPS